MSAPRASLRFRQRAWAWFRQYVPGLPKQGRRVKAPSKAVAAPVPVPVAIVEEIVAVGEESVAASDVVAEVRLVEGAAEATSSEPSEGVKQHLRGVIEALVFAADKPMSLGDLARARLRPQAATICWRCAGPRTSRAFGAAWRFSSFARFVIPCERRAGA